MAASHTAGIRQSVIAGSWYPGRERALLGVVDQYLANVEPQPLAGDLVGLISPHAGYAYSGQTAAFAYHLLGGRHVDLVVVIGPSHRAWMGDWATNEETAYETPLGRVAVDQEFLGELSELVSLRRVKGDREHSLEIQLPFLQRQLGDFWLVPIMMSTDNPALARELATGLVQVIRRRAQDGLRCLLVASSDLHHSHDYAEVVENDQRVVDALASYDLGRATHVLTARGSTVCGRMPILTVLHACRELGADAVQILHHTNSGDVTGQRQAGQYTVGYVAAAVLASEPGAAEGS
jgi:AmmeMemoRadiSam system protein B